LRGHRGQTYQQDAYLQLTDYVKKRGAKRGYLLTFNFRQKKEINSSLTQKGFEIGFANQP